MAITAKPEWLRKKITPSRHGEMKALLERSGVRTICEEALCPNITECFGEGVATFMILGERCTRGCTFCAVLRGRPDAPDPGEPRRIAEAVSELGLRHVVITSPTRDDLPDGGAEHFARTVAEIKGVDGSVTVELLIPDMNGSVEALGVIARCGAEIVAHNLETVPRLYGVRKGADYARSLRVLRDLYRLNPRVATKSAIMLGLGERGEEVEALMGDLLASGCRLLSIGQYLSPSPAHEPVVEYVPPERFEALRQKGIEMGFDYIKSSPYTRSSYMAHEYRRVT